MFATARSASSTMPCFTPCGSSPPPGEQQEEQVDHPGHSDLGLADSHRLDEHDVEARRFAHEHPRRVRRATPPRVPPDGDGRICAAGSRDSFSMRVLSPRIEPPLRASTGRRRAPRRDGRPPRDTRRCLDEGRLAAPGAPLIPARRATRRGHQCVDRRDRFRGGRSRGLDECDRLGERARSPARTARASSITQPSGRPAPATRSPKRRGMLLPGRTRRRHRVSGEVVSEAGITPPTTTMMSRSSARSASTSCGTSVCARQRLARHR